MDFNKQILAIQELISRGKIAEARNCLEKLERDNSLKKLIIAGLLIDIGSADSDKSTIQEGVNLIKDNLEYAKNATDKSFLPSIYYNLANGYFGLAVCNKKSNPFFPCFNKTEFRDAKKYYIESLKNSSSDSKLQAQIWTNLGNCYSDTGRVLESLECYEHALTLFPEFPEALANKGESLIYYANLSAEHQAHFIIDGYQLMKQAIDGEMDEEIKRRMIKRLQDIESRAIDKSVLSRKFDAPGINIKADSDFEIFLTEFCLKHGLYLNICSFCNKCDSAVGDPITIRQLIVDKCDIKHDFSDDPFMILSGFLNHIKQDYVTARFLLAMSRYNKIDLGFVDKNVRIINTLQYNEHNIYIELAKTSFVQAYNILDKIAQFINQYLNMGIEDKYVYFQNIWYDDFKKKIVKNVLINQQSFPLNAIYDIHLDVLEGNKRHLLETRHALVHRFLDVNMFDGTGPNCISEDELIKRCIELLQLVRNVIIYLLFFVDVKERNKNIPENQLGKLYAIDVPDYIKSERHMSLK